MLFRVRDGPAASDRMVARYLPRRSAGPASGMITERVVPRSRSGTMARPALRDDRAEDGPLKAGGARRPHARPSRAGARLREMAGRLEHIFDRAVLALGRSLGGPAGNGRARGVLHVFLLAQRLTERGHHLHQVRPDGVVLYEIARLPSKPLPLTHQPAVRRGERVVVLHFDNGALARMAAAAPSRQSVPWQ